jgi:peptidoglycan hydrolase-like protein with peptidoglycan-binding domain
LASTGALAMIASSHGSACDRTTPRAAGGTRRRGHDRLGEAFGEQHRDNLAVSSRRVRAPRLARSSAEELRKRGRGRVRACAASASAVDTSSPVWDHRPVAVRAIDGAGPGAAQSRREEADSPIAGPAGRARIAGDGATVAGDFSVADVLGLQRSVGNRAVRKLLQRDGPAAATDQLKSPRFMGPDGAPDPTLEACFEDRARLTVGAESDPVKMVQQALADLGYDLGPTGVDGIYGSYTARAVRSFKADQNLGFEQSGDVGPGTMHRLDQLFPARGQSGPSGRDLFDVATFGSYQAFYDAALQGTTSKTSLSVAERTALADRIARRVMDLIFTTGFGHDPDSPTEFNSATTDWKAHFTSALQETTAGDYTSVDVPINQAAAIADQATQATRQHGRDVNARAGAPGASEEDRFNQNTFGQYQELYDVALQGTASKAGLTAAGQASLADRIAQRVMELVFTTGGFGPDPDLASTSKFASHVWRGHFQSALQVTAGGTYTSVDVPINQAAAIADQATARTRKKGRDDSAKVKGTFP